MEPSAEESIPMVQEIGQTVDPSENPAPAVYKKVQKKDYHGSFSYLKRIKDRYRRSLFFRDDSRISPFKMVIFKISNRSNAKLNVEFELRDKIESLSQVRSKPWGEYFEGNRSFRKLNSYRIRALCDENLSGGLFTDYKFPQNFLEEIRATIAQQTHNNPKGSTRARARARKKLSLSHN